MKPPTWGHAWISEETLAGLSLRLGVYVLVGLLVLVTTVLVPVAGLFDKPELPNQGRTLSGTIVRVLEDRTEPGPGGGQRRQRLEVEVDGNLLRIDHQESADSGFRLDLKAGDNVLVTEAPGPQGATYFVSDHTRGFPIWVFAAIFAGLVIAISRWQGITSLIAMALSLLVIVRFIIPGIVSGSDPVTISLIGAGVILACSLFLSHGINSKTVTALAGTGISLVATTLLADFAIDFARLTGLADEQAATLQILTAGGLDATGLLLSAIIIGSLGVLDDVAVAQSSAVFELQAANPSLTPAQLYQRAMNIGRDHIASTVNTLFLAYTGSALPLVLVLSLQTESLGVLMNREFMATEIMRTLVGSIGIVASVPVTTLMAAAVAARRQRFSHGPSDRVYQEGRESVSR